MSNISDLKRRIYAILEEETPLRRFKITASTKRGSKYIFYVRNYNWNGIEEIALKTIKNLIDTRKINGSEPWFVKSVEIE